MDTFSICIIVKSCDWTVSVARAFEWDRSLSVISLHTHIINKIANSRLVYWVNFYKQKRREMSGSIHYVCKTEDFELSRLGDSTISIQTMIKFENKSDLLICLSFFWILEQWTDSYGIQPVEPPQLQSDHTFYYQQNAFNFDDMERFQYQQQLQQQQTNELTQITPPQTPPMVHIKDDYIVSICVSLLLCLLDFKLLSLSFLVWTLILDGF